MKKFMSNALLVCLSVVIGLVLCEVAVRVLAPQRLNPPRPIYQPDVDLVYKLKKNYRGVYSTPEFKILEVTNSIGIRDHEISPKSPNVFRILGLGDSFSYSNSVNLESTYFKQLQNCLNASGGRQVEVINAAVPAYSLIQELRYLERDGITLRPDAVLLGFYVGNDFYDSYELFDSLGQPTIKVADDMIWATERMQRAVHVSPQESFRTWTFGLRGFWGAHSQLYVFLRERSHNLLWRLGLRANAPPPDFCAKTFSNKMQKGWELVQQLLLELETFTRQRNIRLIIVALPTQYQVHQELWKHHFEAFRFDPDLYDLDKPQKILRDFCKQHEIEFLDVLTAMRSVAAEGLLFYPIASYMNPEGHRLVAREVCNYLLRKDVPRPKTIDR